MCGRTLRAQALVMVRQNRLVRKYAAILLPRSTLPGRYSPLKECHLIRGSPNPVCLNRETQT